MKKKFNWARFENHWDLLLRDFAKETQIHNSHKIFEKRILSKKQNIRYTKISFDFLVFKIQGIVWDLSMLRITRYKLTKRTTKTEKVEKSLNIIKKYNILILRLLAIN